MNDGKNIKPQNKAKTKRVYSLGINDKEEPKRQKTTIEKIASFLGSMYYGISIILILTISVTGVGILVTNYNVFPIIEKIFIKDENAEKAKETLIEMQGLDLNKDIVTEEELQIIKNRIDSEIASVILEESLFKEGQIAFNNKMKMFYTQSYLEKINTEDVLYNELSEIYDFDNRHPFSVSLTSIGKVMKNDKSITKAIVDINAVDDDKGFHVTSIAMFFNNKYEIQDMKVVFNNKDYVNTRTPLNLEYSLVTNSTYNIMVREINKFLKDFNNKSLYDKIQMSSLDINNSQLKAFFSNLDIEQKDYDVLSELFKLVKGNTRNLAIIEYIQTDFNTEAITSIVIGVKTTEKIYKYNLQFDRCTESLISISKI